MGFLEKCETFFEDLPDIDAVLACSRYDALEWDDDRRDERPSHGRRR